MKTEIIVFGAILAFVAILSLTIALPQMNTTLDGAIPLSDFGKAPEITGTQQWINSEPLSLSQLKGKVIVVDFWTYSCINCIRTLPYLNNWHEKYSDAGLVIIGVHTPEFEFEKDYNNVLMAVEKYGIKYPVVQDNNYATWRAYGNSFWPRKYIVDKEGAIRYDHIGEGAYDETERVIQQLLGEKGELSNITQRINYSGIGTPELYLGYRFARAPLGNPEGFVHDETVNYSFNGSAVPNIAYLEGSWKNNPDHVEAISQGRIFLLYSAKDLNIVAGGPADLQVYIDNRTLGEGFYGSDAAASGIVSVGEQRLYNLVSAPAYGNHLIEIRTSPGLRLYTFTFG